MKPKLFIGSSGESLSIAKALQALLNNDFDVKVWDEAFYAGEFFMERLQKELFITDFALLIVAPDDKIDKRGIKGYTTRDNVLFELGMFIGALGTKKAQCLIVDVVKEGEKLSLLLPSDLGGITITKVKLNIGSNAKFVETTENGEAIKNVAAKLTAGLLKKQFSLTLNLLPSTPLAIGYYRNFILQACKHLSQKKDFAINNTVYDMTKDQYDFYIVIPDKGSDASHEAYQKFVRLNDLKPIEIKANESGARAFPFFIRSDIKNGKIQLYDWPTTLRASREAIKLVMPMATAPEEIKELELKEILNFRNTLEYLLKEPESDGFRDNIHLVAASEL